MLVFLMSTILIEDIGLVCERSEYRLCRRDGILLVGLGRLSHQLNRVLCFWLVRVSCLGFAVVVFLELAGAISLGLTGEILCGLVGEILYEQVGEILCELIGEILFGLAGGILGQRVWALLVYLAS